MAKAPRKAASLPTREDLLAFIEDSADAVGRRDIARAFDIRGAGRAALRGLLRDLEDEGLIGRERGKRVATVSRLPSVAVVEIGGIDEDGDAIARPVVWNGKGEPPRIVMIAERRGRPAPGIGDRVLARLKRLSDTLYEGRTIRRLPHESGKGRRGNGTDRIVGVYRRVGAEGRVVPAERRARTEFAVARGDSLDAEPEELVVAEIQPGRRLGLPQVRIVERLGPTLDDPHAISTLAIHSHGIPVDLPPAAIAEAKAARRVMTPGKRTDLRELALVTIDGADARDFDDAVWAEADPETPGGWHAVVAIADVAHYVRPGNALDRAAYGRGNSVYFPDRVVPMLPEALSNDLCSLRPGEPRPCLAAHLWIGADGALTRHKFVRGLMRSVARLTYEQVQAVHDGASDETAGPLAGTVIAPLYGVFRSLEKARRRRGTLDLDLPEHQVIFDAKGRVADVRPRRRLDSHRLIEELMIAANVAAAETLEALSAPVMYRVHDRPSAEKVVDLRAFLAGLGHRLASGGGGKLRPGDLGDVLRQVKGKPHAPAVNTAILRSQSQAAYSPRNIGHFGLGLRRYSHFTSPIRRYADLLVHRALIAGLGLGAGGLEDGAGERFDATAEHLSTTERRAAVAERDAMGRFVTAYMAERVGETFPGRISGATRFGLFVALDGTGAEGIVPRRSLPGRFVHDEERQELVGENLVLRLGDAVEVRLREAEVVSGSLVFELVSGGRETSGRSNRDGRKSAAKSRPPKRGRKRRR